MVSTNKSIPAPTVIVSADIRKWMLRVIIALAIIVTITVIASLIRSQREAVPNIPQQHTASRSEVPRASALPQNSPNLPRAWNADGSMTDSSKWPRVQVPPHGDSVHVPSVFGGHIVWGGSGFKIHYVYSDGHECIIGDTSSSCSDGNIVEGYARNEGDTPLYASYAYAYQNEK